jgi:hypothetical protein
MVVSGSVELKSLAPGQVRSGVLRLHRHAGKGCRIRDLRTDGGVVHLLGGDHT